MIKLYDTQVQIKQDITKLIEDGGCLCIESPTGSGKTLALLSAVEDYLQKEPDTTVYYLSKTVSQLSQSIREFRRLNSPSNSIVWSSRTHLCVNDSVRSSSDIDTACKESSCPLKLCDATYTTMCYNKDIEELTSLGRRVNFCPYYATRSVKTQIVFLTYNYVLDLSLRSKFDLRFDDSVVVIDEAHNLVDSVRSIHSATLTHSHASRLMEYAQTMSGKYTKSFKAFVVLLNKLTRALRSSPAVLTISEFSTTCGIQNTNCLEIVENLKGFVIKDGPKDKSGSMAALIGGRERRVENSEAVGKLFNNSEADGKLFNNSEVVGKLFDDALRFVMLLGYTESSSKIVVEDEIIKLLPVEPKIFFEDVLRSRVLVLASGTLSPIELLLPLLPRNTIFKSYGDDLKRDFSSFIVGKDFEFSYEKRNSKIDLLLDYLIECCAVVPSGVLCFVPSYDYLNEVRRSKRLNEASFSNKKVFFEGRSATEYSLYTENCKKGALLFAVVNGRLSEGINFSDEHARLVVIVGVPFPRQNTEVALMEKTYGKDYRSLVAMRIVNQAIGRCLRHRKDYACAVLLDERFKRTELKKRLSTWIRPNECGREETIARIKEFFRNR